VASDALRLASAEDRDLTALVENDLVRLMGIGVPPLHSMVNRWPASMPQYVVGHKLRQERITACLAGYPSLALVGNAYDGVGIPDCVRLARNAAQQLIRN
jgi:oxygen-dependent protoporphyrinogen oxidase